MPNAAGPTGGLRDLALETAAEAGKGFDERRAVTGSVGGEAFPGNWRSVAWTAGGPVPTGEPGLGKCGDALGRDGAAHILPREVDLQSDGTADAGCTGTQANTCPKLRPRNGEAPLGL